MLCGKRSLYFGDHYNLIKNDMSRQIFVKYYELRMIEIENTICRINAICQ